MENSKESGAGEKTVEANPNPNPNSSPNPNPNPSPAPSAANSDESAAVSAAAEAAAAPARRPFTALSQVDADLALARVLQEQERAYMMLRMGGDGSEYSSDGGSYDEYEEEEEFDGGEEGIDHDHDHLIGEGEGDGMDGSYYDEDAFDANNNHEVDAGEFEDDEAFARALQDAEEREVAVRLMALAGLSEWRPVEPEDHGSNSQDAWQEVDPDEYSYEELIAIGEVVGTESRGASADTIASLPSVNYKSQNSQEENAEQCVVCRVEFEDDESLSILPCKHMYHPECISKWLQINKACPMCSAEVSTSGDSRQD